MSHTPAPWFFAYAQRGYVIVNKQNTYDIAVVRNVGNENNEANARVIAAAPELLEALKAIVSSSESGLAAVNTFLIIDAKDAIAKAEGRSA